MQALFQTLVQKKTILSCILALNLLCINGLNAATETRPFGERSIFSPSATKERLEPIAKVCIEGEACQEQAGASGAEKTTLAVNEEANTPKTAEVIYQGKCMACHATGAAGAPKVGDAAAWKSRLAKGLETIVVNAINGVGAMPPKGMCMDCSDEDIRMTVEYMIK